MRSNIIFDPEDVTDDLPRFPRKLDFILKLETPQLT